MYYISYGSNMNIEQMFTRCPNTSVYGTGKLYGWKLVFNYHADIIETGNPDDIVPVVVWNLIDEDDARALDVYEGFPNYYIKKNIEVVMDDDRKKIRAMVYVMADARKGIYPPTIHYFKTIRDGYIDNNINLKTLYDAAKFCLDEKNITRYNQYNARKGKVNPNAKKKN